MTIIVEKLPADYFPRIVTLATGAKVRVTRCDAADIAFDRGTVDAQGTFITTHPAQGVAPIPGFDPGTAEQWPSDTDLAVAINSPQPALITPVRLTPLEVLGRLTQAEEVALTTATDLAVAIVRQRFIAATYIDSSDTRTAEGIAILIAKGIITQARAAQIFA